jgi:hypothetical protein
MAEVSGELADTLKEGTYTTPLVDPLTDEEDGKQYRNSNPPIKPREDNLSMSKYNSAVLEVSSGKFEAAHGQKYKEPANFLQALWNEAGLTVGSMKIMLTKPTKTSMTWDWLSMPGLFAIIARCPMTVFNSSWSTWAKQAKTPSGTSIPSLNSTNYQLQDAPSVLTVAASRMPWAAMWTLHCNRL